MLGHVGRLSRCCAASSAAMDSVSCKTTFSLWPRIVGHLVWGLVEGVRHLPFAAGIDAYLGASESEKQIGKMIGNKKGLLSWKVLS